MKLDVDTVIGTGDPSDVIMLMPLLFDWRVPKNCLVALRGEVCERPLARMYILREPVSGHKRLGICEAHHQELIAAGELAPVVADAMQLFERQEGMCPDPLASTGLAASAGALGARAGEEEGLTVSGGCG